MQNPDRGNISKTEEDEDEYLVKKVNQTSETVKRKKLEVEMQALSNVDVNKAAILHHHKDK